MTFSTDPLFPIAAPLPIIFDTDFLTAFNSEDVNIHGGEAHCLIQYLDEATMRSPGDDSTTSDFVVALLRGLVFAPKGTMIRSWWKEAICKGGCMHCRGYRSSTHRPTR